MSTRPPSALAGGTASRLTSAMNTNATVPSQRIGTAIGFAETVSHNSKKSKTNSSNIHFLLLEEPPSNFDFSQMACMNFFYMIRYDEHMNK